jgi:hypothetical protein
MPIKSMSACSIKKNPTVRRAVQRKLKSNPFFRFHSLVVGQMIGISLQAGYRLFCLCIALIIFGECASAAGESTPVGTNALPQEESNLALAKGTFEGWTVEGENTWSLGLSPETFSNPTDPKRYVVNSLEKGESNVGVLRSVPFTVRARQQKFSIAGWDGTADTTDGGESNFVLLRSYPDGAVLRRAHTPGGNKLVSMTWNTPDLIGRKVYLEVVDNNPVVHAGGFAWIAFADYRQEQPEQPDVMQSVSRNDLYALKIDGNAEEVFCRSMPFLAASPEHRGKTTRAITGSVEEIPVGVSASAIYLLGMMNEGWDMGVAHWGEHPELRTKRDDQINIGSRIGDIEICYADGKSDRIPVVIGATAWFVAQWADGPTHNVTSPIHEPFASRPEYMAVLRKALRIRESSEVVTPDTRHICYYLAIKPRPGVIKSIMVHDNPDLRGRPLVSAVTLACAKPSAALHHFETMTVDASDLKPAVDSAHPGDWSADITALAKVLYTSASDLPKKVKPIDFPKSLDAARLRFIGGTLGDMLGNIWIANLAQMDEKFDRNTGIFNEDGKTSPWYGGYSGIGTWSPIGVYYGGGFGRCAEAYASLAMRCINDPVRTDNYVNYCDKWLYFYRPNHDRDKGPDNAALDVARYPKDAPPHWSFGVNSPISIDLNELPGTEEMDGHGAVIVGRWMAWRLMGAPSGEWLKEPRKDVYGKSRWDATHDAAEFICWFMDYTGRDVVWSEGETTGWGGGESQTRKNIKGETDPAKIKENYANADMYEPYPNFACLTALKCSAQIADAAGDAASAKKWRAYADRIREGMIRLLKNGDHNNFTWRVSPNSVLPSLQDSLVQAWFSVYLDGLDPNKLDPVMTPITRNTLKRQLSQPYGFAPVLGMGYGQGWITESALILDDMDSAGRLLSNLAKYSYDKNMDYVDEKRGIDWRPYLWLIPEGANIMPDGRWYRIGDLSNGANQGPAMHALELCAGVDDTDPGLVKIIPRVPEPLKELQVENFFTLVPDKNGLAKARVGYVFKKPGYFTLTSDRPIPRLAVRLGPFDELTAQQVAATGSKPNGSTVRLDKSGTWNGKNAWWLWLENLHDVTGIKLEFDKKRR